MSIHIESCPTDGFLAGSAIQELSELWHLRGKEVAWQVLFEAFGEQLATLMEMKKRARTAPAEPETPNNKKKQKSRPALPSPPALSPEKAAADLPQCVSSCRPASFGQPEKKDTYLARALRKRTMTGFMLPMRT